VVPSRDFVAVKLQWQAKDAAVRKDPGAAREAATKLVLLSQEPGQHPFAKLIISLQSKEAQAFAAEAAGDTGDAVAKLKEAVAIEDSIDDLSRPPYPRPIPRFLQMNFAEICCSNSSAPGKRRRTFRKPPCGRRIVPRSSLDWRAQLTLWVTARQPARGTKNFWQFGERLIPTVRNSLRQRSSYVGVIGRRLISTESSLGKLTSAPQTGLC
jgi:hypothetical protein